MRQPRRPRCGAADYGVAVRSRKRKVEPPKPEIPRSALCWTEPVLPDVPPPTWESPQPRLTKGFLYNAYTMSVDKGCSSMTGHARGQDHQTTTQNPMSLYSTRELAYKAMRHELELQFAEKLHTIDLHLSRQQQGGGE